MGKMPCIEYFRIRGTHGKDSTEFCEKYPEPSRRAKLSFATYGFENNVEAN